LVVAAVLVGGLASTQWAGRGTFAAVPGVKGGQEMFGPYEVDRNWPQNVLALPGNEAWAWGAGQGVFAESPDRVYLLFRDGVHGLDHRWEHCLIVVNREGQIIEEWTQWSHLFGRLHFVAVDPWDPEKHVWVVDDARHAIFRFTNDGKELVQTIGVPNEYGNDMAHFNRPTFLAFTPDWVFVADGYGNTRVVKLDKGGNFVATWGQPGAPGGNETRPGYMNKVHGVAVDLERSRVYVNDRQNNRVQIFDYDGNYQDEWSFGPEPTDIHLIYMGADNVLWAVDRATSKILGYNRNGGLIYSWGISGDFPGAFRGVHGISVDQEGNFYVAEVGGRRAQRFIPREGARTATMIGKPHYAAWK
jgi:DNA-binding beta-propeller fold protein YncE